MDQAPQSLQELWLHAVDRRDASRRCCCEGGEHVSTEHFGLTLGHEAAEAAADNAGIEWRETAFDAFVKYAKTHEFFTTEEVRHKYTEIPPPPDTRAWGAIPRQAKRENIIEGVGLVRANDRNVHGRFITQWRSKIYQG
jgi:hypothetical protein